MIGLLLPNSESLKITSTGKMKSGKKSLSVRDLRSGLRDGDGAIVNIQVSEKSIKVPGPDEYQTISAMVDQNS